MSYKHVEPALVCAATPFYRHLAFGEMCPKCLGGLSRTYEFSFFYNDYGMPDFLNVVCRRCNHQLGREFCHDFDSEFSIEMWRERAKEAARLMELREAKYKRTS